MLFRTQSVHTPSLRLPGVKFRFLVVLTLAMGLLASNVEVPPASALTGLTLEVDYTPDSSAIATSATRGSKIDLTAGTPVAVAGTTMQEIVMQLAPDLDLQSTDDIKAPEGWTIYFSTDGSTWTSEAPTTVADWKAITYVKASGPLISEGADGNGRQIASADSVGLQPSTGSFSATPSGQTGDGWDIIFDDAGHVFNVWHHQQHSGIDCHKRDGTTCDGTWPFELQGDNVPSQWPRPFFNESAEGTFQMATSNFSTAWYDSVDKEVWIPSVYQVATATGVDASVGFTCISVADITEVNKFCGGYGNTAFVTGGAGSEVDFSDKCGADQIYDCNQGLAISGSRLFTWNVKTGDLICVDIRLNAGAGGPCASGGVIDFGANIPEASKANFFATIGAWGGRIYAGTDEFSPGPAYAACIVAATGAACPGWTNPRTIPFGTSRFAQLPGLTAQAGARGACFLGVYNDQGDITAAKCFNAAGNDITSSLTTAFLNGYKNGGSGLYTNFNPTYGTRMYWGAGGGGAGIHCWDFALNNWCVNWTAAGITDTNYQVAIDPMKPTCIWSNADDGVIETYDGITGAAGNCAVPAPTVVFDGGLVLPRMACSSANAIQAWRNFTVTTASVFTSATLTVKDTAGNAIPAWTNVAIPGSKIVDLSSLAVSSTGQRPTFTITFTGRQTDGDVSARISAVGGSPELCLRPIIACPSSSVIHASQMAAGTLTATATGSTTAGATVSQFDPVVKTINLAATPDSSCGAKLSGTLTTGSGTAVAGVVVALLDAAGSPLSYPADYPTTALRNQPITTMSDGSGAYAFPLLAPGDYKVKFVDESAGVVVNIASISAGGTGMTSDYTSATSLTSPMIALALGVPGVIDAKYNTSQLLTKAFFPSVVSVGQVSTLVFTVTKPAAAARSGIAFTDTLPTGLVVDTFPNRRTNCPSGGATQTVDPAQMTGLPGATSVSVTGLNLPSGTVTCTFSISVKATTAGDYHNGMVNVAATNIDKSTDATVTVVPATTPGSSVCDGNLFTVQGGQLFRQSPLSAAAFPVGPASQAGGIGVIGYNSLDGQLYGIASSGFSANGVSITAGHLVKISGNGAMTDLGSMTGTNISDSTMATMVGGDFDNSGNFVVKPNYPGTTIYTVNVATKVATEITLSSWIEGDDMAYSNGSFYSSGGMNVYRVEVSAGTSWTSSSQQIFPSNYGSHAATFSNSQGKVIFVDGNGDAYATNNIATATATSDFTLLYHYTYGPNDGAMCHGAPLPIAAPDTSSGPKNVAQTKNLLSNDSAPLSATGISLNPASVKLCNPNSNPAEQAPNCTVGAGSTITVASVGTYSVDSSGVVTFTPVNEYTGNPAALGYQVADSNGNIASSTYTPRILSGGPVLVDDTSSGAYDTNQVVTVLTNDTPSASATMTASSVKLCATTATANSSCTLSTLTVPGEGTYTANANGTITFDPLPTFKGTATPVKYVAADSTTLLGGATITPSVTAPNAPVATAQTKSVAAGGSTAFTTLTGASGLATATAGFDTAATCLITPASSPAACDADGVVAIAGEGTYTLNTSTGVVTYAADAGATTGAKTAITYQVQDVTGQKATSTLTPSIAAPLTAANDTSTGAYDTNQTISVLANDTAGAGATLTPSTVKLCATTATANSSCTLSTLTVPGEGMYTANANGTITFDPLPTFKGVAAPVKYVVADSTNTTVGATITSTVTAPAAPVATSNVKAVLPGASVSFTTLTGASGLATAAAGFNTAATCLIIPASSPAACDADGVVAIAGEGTYTLNTSTGVVTYAADAGATTGAKTAITYQVQDITGQKATSTLTPTIPPAPSTTADTSTGAFDTNQTISVLTNDTVVSPVTFVVTSVKLCATTATVNSACTLSTLPVPGEGTYTVNANGTITFDPLPTFVGTATAVKYAVTDSTGQSAGANVTPTVSNPAAPVATPDAKAVIAGGTVTFATITGANGLATAAGGLNASLTCLITPGSSPDACDADGIVTVAGVGTYTLNTTTGVVTLVADPSATQGTKASLKYQVTDMFGQKTTSTLTPTIPAAPSATADTATGAFDTNQTISVLTNDTVVSPVTFVATSVKLCATTATVNSACTLSTLTVPGEGTYTANANGTVTFDPLPTFVGTATAVKYAVTDSTGQLAGANVTLTVSNPAAPTATADAPAAGVFDTNQTVSLLANDTPGASSLPLLASTLRLCPLAAVAPFTTTNCNLAPTQSAPLITADGSYWIDPATGVLTFDPASTFAGTVTQPIRYVVLDGMNQVATATVTLRVSSPAAPTATPQTKVVAPGTSITYTNLIGANALASGAGLQTGTTNGPCLINPADNVCGTTVTIAGEGTWTVDRTTGIVTFAALSTITVGTKTPVTYKVTDLLGQTATSTLTPIVPTAPVAANDSATGNRGATQTISPLANDTFAANAPVVLSSVKLCAAGETPNNCTRTTLTVANEGTYSVNSSGVISFVPLATFTGTATPVVYQVSNIAGNVVHANITVTVAATGSTPVSSSTPTPAAKADAVSGKKGSKIFFSPWLNDSPGVSANNEKVKIDPTSLRLCGAGEKAPKCSRTALATDDGNYFVDTKTGKVTFVPRADFVGVAKAVTYQIANSWKGMQKPGVASGTLIPTVTDPELPATGNSSLPMALYAGLILMLGVLVLKRSSLKCRPASDC